MLRTLLAVMTPLVWGQNTTISPNGLTFQRPPGAQNPPAQPLSLATPGPSFYTAIPSTTSGGNWLSVSPATGPAPAELMVKVSPGEPGTHHGTIVITTAGGAFHVPVTLDVKPG